MGISHRCKKHTLSDHLILLGILMESGEYLNTRVLMQPRHVTVSSCTIFGSRLGISYANSYMSNLKHDVLDREQGCILSRSIALHFNNLKLLLQHKLEGLLISHFCIVIRKVL